jgi:hypothetical protein
MGRHLSPNDISISHALRGKWWTWTEMYIINKMLPAEIIRDLQSIKINQTDPLWLFTQSAKNYQTDFDIILSKYSSSEVLKNHTNAYGISTQLSQPSWETLTYDNQWYWHNVKSAKIAHKLSYIPGVYKIFRVGSGALKLATTVDRSSDMDFAIQCYPYCCVMVRFYLKICIKILGLDVHSFLTKRRNPKGSIDAGIFFESEKQLEIQHVYEARQLSVILKQELTANHYGYIMIWLLFPINIIVYCFALIQLPYYALRIKDKKNLIFGHRYISFLPKYYADKKSIRVMHQYPSTVHQEPLH